MDYFARDCHGLGMKSNFDHLRYISQCRVMFSSDKPDETTIAVRDKVNTQLCIHVHIHDIVYYPKRSQHYYFIGPEYTGEAFIVEMHICCSAVLLVPLI